MSVRLALFACLVPLAAIFVLSSCSSKDRVSKPDEIGEQVVNLLDEMDDLTMSEFSDYFMSAGDMRKMGENKDLKLDPEVRKALKNTTKNQVKLRHTFMFNRLKRKGRRLGIGWADIKLSDFNYETENPDDSYVLRGALVFRDGKRKFKVRTTSVFDGKNYYLVGLEGLMEYKPEFDNFSDHR